MARKKIGTVIVLNTELGEIYLGEGDVLATNISSAKNFRAPKKVLQTIVTQTAEKFAYFNAKVSTIERWTDQ